MMRKLVVLFRTRDGAEEPLNSITSSCYDVVVAKKQCLPFPCLRILCVQGKQPSDFGGVGTGVSWFRCDSPIYRVVIGVTGREVVMQHNPSRSQVVMTDGHPSRDGRPVVDA